MSSQSDITRDVTLAEASAWLVKLQDETRTAATEAAFKVWLEEADHAHAFAQVTDTWEIIRGAGSRSRRGQAPKRLRVLAVLAASIAVIAFGGAAWLFRDPTYDTLPGQQETVRLNDGTHVSLNTNTRLTVHYTRKERHVRLERGEALFEVAKNPNRPFVVLAGGEEVRALGTTFVVRREAARLSVTLVEGRVEVRQQTRSAPGPTKLAILAPGERLTVKPNEAVAVDRPQIEAATAWRRGELIFEDASLSDAVDELNRYGGQPVVLADPRIAGLRVSGVFRTGAADEFAQTIAELHHLEVRQDDGKIVLHR
jgi:transmembrane sensor